MKHSPTGWLMVALLATRAAGLAESQASDGPTPSKTMPNVNLEPLIQARDWSAVEVARRNGPAVTPSLARYLGDPDELVRLLAVDCIAAAGGPEAPALLLRGTRDANEQVRIDAVNGLHRWPPIGREAELLKVWDQTQDPFLRRQIPMVLGRTSAASASAPLATRLKDLPADADRGTREGLVAGLAKLGDPTARTDLREVLANARGEGVKDAIDLFRYVDDAKLVGYLRPVLNRRETAVDLSSHRTKLLRRGCDLAVDETARVTGTKFSFPINPSGQYGDPQIQEVATFIDRKK